YEYDRIFATYVDDNTGQTITLTPQPGLVTLSNSPVGSSRSNSTLYTVAGGGSVFAGGTIEWSSGLDSHGYGCTGGCVSPALQKTTTNILNQFGS
ncbi:MAG TPA: N,N-dimethylformamidase beta subunit family domain-containing protein, partial [Candidatus Limnocylindria bacterium]|nr:N,N-dimethylformamidase beta subunit family domain-containing protein [Candidatus Limnocylindria bacterium]